MATPPERPPLRPGSRGAPHRRAEEDRMTTGELGERVARLEARAALHELVARYAHAVDDRDEAALVSMYTPDAVFISIGGTTIGPEAIAAYLRQRAEMNGATVHTPDTQVLSWESPEV